MAVRFPARAPINKNAQPCRGFFWLPLPVNRGRLSGLTWGPRLCGSGGFVVTSSSRMWHRNRDADPALRIAIPSTMSACIRIPRHAQPMNIGQ